MVVFIRRVSEPSVSHICLLTAAAGYSVENRHEYGEFPGLVYTVSYRGNMSVFQRRLGGRL